MVMVELMPEIEQEKDHKQLERLRRLWTLLEISILKFHSLHSIGKNMFSQS
jgi:hypothetical protein